MAAAIPREKLVNTAKEKLLTAIDEARESYNARRGQRRSSGSSTIPPTHQYRIANEDSVLLWGEEKVADLDTTLLKWPDQNLRSCCDGLDQGQVTVTVVTKTHPDTAENKTISARTEKDSNSAEDAPPKSPWATEKYTDAQEQIHEKLRRKISLKIGRPLEPTHTNQGSIGNPRINPLKSDASPPNQYFWTFSPQYPAFPDTRISRWTPQQIVECHTALDEGYLQVGQVEAVTPQLPHTRERGSLGLSIPTPEPRNRTARQRRADETRTLLHDTIVSTIGRDIQRRNSSTNHINPTRDDPDPPNGYRWVFSVNYKTFPDNNEKRLKDWTIDEHDACRTAIQNGWLRVDSMLSPSLDSMLNPSLFTASRPRQSLPTQNIPEQRLPDKAVSLLKSQIAAEVPSLDRTATVPKREPPPIKSPPKLPAIIQTELSLDKKLTGLLSEPLTQLQSVVETVLKAHGDAEALIREEVKKKNEQINQLKYQLSISEQNVRRIRQGNAVDLDKIAQAKEEGRREGQELAMKLMREADEARKEIELRTHFSQIQRAREEGRQAGLRQARQNENDRGRNETEVMDSEDFRASLGNGDSHGVAAERSDDPESSYADPSQATIDNATPEASQDYPRRSARPPRPSSVRGFQAINKQSEANASVSNASHGTKRARSSDSSHEMADSSGAATPQEATESKTEDTTPDEDLYGTSPPPKRAKVLNSVSSAKRKELTEQWKPSNDHSDDHKSTRVHESNIPSPN